DRVARRSGDRELRREADGEAAREGCAETARLEGQGVAVCVLPPSGDVWCELRIVVAEDVGKRLRERQLERRQRAQAAAGGGPREHDRLPCPREPGDLPRRAGP